MKKQASLFIILLIFLAAITANGQEGIALENQANKLHKSYRFDEAITIYKKILEQSTDSLYRINIENKLILSENGKALLDFASTPIVLAKEKFKVSDFFLHYPGFKDKSWVPLPQNLAEGLSKESAIGDIPLIYFPSGIKKLVYSAPDNSGSWNIYITQKINDSLWSAPVILNENITSVGNEVFPYLSPDEKTLYFASNGHYGMGGYDLYVSNWDDETNDWGIAQNLGFPFSSVGDDFLFYNTPDGLHSVFASNRDNTAEDVTIYAVNFESTPLKKGITPQLAEQIAHLNIEDKSLEKEDVLHSGESNPETVKNTPEELSEYTLAVKGVRKLQQEIKAALKQQKENRELYTTLTNADDLSLLEKKIAIQENKTLTIQQELNSALENLNKIETDFLSKGIIISNNNGSTTSDTSIEEAPKFVFANNTLGSMPKMIVEATVPQVDLSFKILDKAVIANIEDFPTSLTYQIQLFVLTNKSSLKALKGLNPVFERNSGGGKYIYSVGIFNTYEEALKNINKVKKLGFSSASIVAYNNGKVLALKNARILEKKEAESAFYKLVINGFETLPTESLNVIRASTEKDIAKTIENGVIKYVVGPFTKKLEADNLKVALDKIGITGVQVEKVESN